MSKDKKIHNIDKREMKNRKKSKYEQSSYESARTSLAELHGGPSLGIATIASSMGMKRFFVQEYRGCDRTVGSPGLSSLNGNVKCIEKCLEPSLQFASETQKQLTFVRKETRRSKTK